jgi:hypothetical protein
MKFVGFVVALLVACTFIAGLGYGGVKAFYYLKSQWLLLLSMQKAQITIIGSLLLICTVVILGSLSTIARKITLYSEGKTKVYTQFVDWYIDCKNGADKNSAFDAMQSGMLLWAHDYVLKQYMQLKTALCEQPNNREMVLKGAELVYLEIRRDLGYGRQKKIRNII